MTETRAPSPLLYWHKVVILLCFGWATLWIYRSALTPVYGEIQASLGVSGDVGMGAIASFYFFAYTGTQIPAGMLMDRFGVKAVMAPSFAFFALAVLCIGFASSLEMLYLGSFIAGLASGPYYSGAFSLSAQTIPESRRTFSNAIINSGSAVGMTIGLIGASWLVKSMGMPWNFLLFLVGGVILFTMACFMLVLKPENSPAGAAISGGEEPEDLSGKTTLFSLRSAGLYCLYFANSYAYFLLVTWLPNFLETERGFHGVAIGMTAALAGLAAIPGGLLFSGLADRFRSRRLWLLVAQESICVGALVLVVLAPTQGILLLGLVVYGMTGKLASDPLLISLVTASAPRKRLGVFLSTFNFFAMTSSVVAPLVTGLISDCFLSKEGGFYVAICLLVLSILFFLFTTRRQES